MPSIDYNHDPKASFFLKNEVFFKNNSEIELKILNRQVWNGLRSFLKLIQLTFQILFKFLIRRFPDKVEFPRVSFKKVGNTGTK